MTEFLLQLCPLFSWKVTSAQRINNLSFVLTNSPVWLTWIFPNLKEASLSVKQTDFIWPEITVGRVSIGFISGTLFSSGKKIDFWFFFQTQNPVKVRSSAEIKSYLEVKLHHFLFPSNVARGGENFFRTSPLFIYKLNLYTPSQPYFVHFGLRQRHRCKQVACLNQQKRKQHYQACYSKGYVTFFSRNTYPVC